MTWALCTTQPQIEARVAAKLVGAGFQLQLFWTKSLVVARGILRNHFKPAFPRYLFVQAEDCWRQIREIEGVTGFLTDSEGYPAVVSGAVVDELLKRSVVVADRTVLEVPPRQSKFHFGDNVQVIGNSLISGRKGIFQSVVGETHATLLIEVMGRFIPFRVPEAELIAVPMRRPRKKHQKNWQARRMRRMSTAALSASAPV